MHKRWIVKQYDPSAAEDLVQKLALHPVCAAILSGRGIGDPRSAQRFLAPALADLLDPATMKGISAAVIRLLDARRTQETICIYGDYDVDGITGTALLVSFLRATGFDCHYFIPNRFDDGYGLNLDSLEQIIDTGCQVVISVDCGITAVEEARYCRQRGVDLIIVDHHTPRETLPDACSVINPLQPGCDYPFKSLAGVGVAFNLVIALRAALREAGAFTAFNEPDLRHWLELVALGTIADVVPLVDQNRIFAFHGLRQLADTPRVGIAALKRVAGITGAVTCGQVGFRLAPRLNAVGRMESAVPGVDLLLGSDVAVCSRVATELDEANAERQSVERRIFEEAVTRIEASGRYPAMRSIVLGSAEWHQGVVGIVASRLVERYNRPTILIACAGDGTAKGSGRSIHGFHLLDAITACSACLDRFGGHRFAAGVNLSAADVEQFAAAFEAEAQRMLTDDDVVPQLQIDVEVQSGDVSKELALELNRLQPFGAGNPEPVLMLRGVTVTDRRPVGVGHLKLRIRKGSASFAAIAFGMAGRSTEGVLDVAFFPEINEWNGSSTLQLRLKDMRPTE